MDNVLFLDAVPKSHIKIYLKEADICFIGSQFSPLYEYGVSPNKLFDYMLSSKPILSTIPCKISPITSANCGWTVKPDDLYPIVKQISQMPKNDLIELGNRGNEFVRKHHSYEQLALKLEDLIN